MGMSQIPPQDKEAVIQRLAQGESYSQAMSGTAIKSKDTVHRIAQLESNAIERKRQQFLKKIKKFGANDERRARMWANMVYATKRAEKGSLEVPDWQARATALKYIDSLADYDNAEKMKIEVTDTTPAKIQEVSEEEKIDFNKKFKKFLETI